MVFGGGAVAILVVVYSFEPRQIVNIFGRRGRRTREQFNGI